MTSLLNRPGNDADPGLSRWSNVLTLLTLFAASALLIPGRWVVGPLGAIGTPAILIGLAGFGWWILAFIQPELGVDRGRQPIRVVTFGFLLTSAVGVVAGFSRFLPAVEASAMARNTIQFVALSGIILLAADGLRSNGEVLSLIDRIVNLGCVVAIVAVLQKFLSIDLAQSLHPPGLTLNTEIVSSVSRGSVNRVTGTALHPIELSAISAGLLPLAIQRAMNASSPTWGWIRVAFLVLSIPIAVSRTGVIMTAVGLFVLLLGFTGAQRIRLLLLSIPAVIAIRLIAPGTLGTIRALFTYWNEDPSISGRTDDYQVIQEFVQESPFVGRGLGTFVPSQYFFVDNQFLYTLVTTGIIGLFGLLALVLGSIVVARQVYHRSADRISRSTANALAASIAALVSGFLTYDALGFPLHSATLALLIGLSGAMWRIEVRDARECNDRASNRARFVQ